MTDLDNFYYEKEEPIKGCLLTLKSIIQNYHPELKQQWKYRLPCFICQNKIFCYL